MTFTLSWDVFFSERMNILVRMLYTFRWILVLPVNPPVHPNYEQTTLQKNVHLNYEKIHPYYEELHPIYEQTTRKEVKKRQTMLHFSLRQILGKGRKRGHYFWPTFVLTELRFALMFPFKQVQFFVHYFCQVWDLSSTLETKV